MKSVKVYTTPSCPYCMKAKQLLTSLEVSFEEVDVAAHSEARAEIIEKHNWQTVPAIFIGNELIGGYDELHALHTAGELEKKLA